MGRLARKEGSIQIILIAIVIVLLVACSPIVTTTSLVHSIVKGDAFGTATGLIGSMRSTLKPKPEPPKKKSRAEVLEELRKTLGEINGSQEK